MKKIGPQIQAVLIAVWSRRFNFLTILRIIFVRFENWMSSMKIIDQKLLVFLNSQASTMGKDPKLQINPLFQDPKLRVGTVSTIQFILTFNLHHPTPKSQLSLSRIHQFLLLSQSPTPKINHQSPNLQKISKPLNYDIILLCFPSVKNWILFN